MRFDGESTMIGQTISHYRIQSRLGAGGMGEVWLARDIRLGHQVAIKKLPKELASERSRRQRFEREAKAARPRGRGSTMNAS